MPKPLNIIFAGTPEFAVPCLQSLYNSEHNICAVYTQPDKPSGRGQKLHASAVKEWSIAKNISVYQPVSLKNSEVQEQLRSFQADLMVVVAYGLILPQAVLEIPRLGCVNVHGSILPRWRGAAPIQYALLAGDTETGITIMQMDVGMDTGDILKIVPYSIQAHDTSASVFQHLAELAPSALLSTIQELITGTYIRHKQDESLATYASKINKDDARIFWNKPAKVIDRQIRAYYPWPIAYTIFNQQVIKIHQARILQNTSSTHKPGTIISFSGDEVLVATLDEIIAISIWQFPNMKKMPVKNWLNGHQHLLPPESILL